MWQGVTLLLLCLDVLLFLSVSPQNWSTVTYISCDEVMSFINFSENEYYQIALHLQS